ncbi:hypothetical protein AA313_de0205949 [Arthrobotrys entomopaga]|nr:hypothetical protein AA313_de0205949 [Arthrobotrys entomopaga]
MPRLVSLPNEILEEIVDLLVPSFPDECSDHKDWGEGPHLKDLFSLCLTCKQLESVTRPHLFKIVVLTYPTRMIRIFRTLIETPSLREMVNTMSICCPLEFSDETVDPFSPRETFLDENPELSLKMKWDPETMDSYAAAVFRAIGLDHDEYKEFTEDELEALNDGSYWMSVPDYAERSAYEGRLMEALAVGLMALSLRLERLTVRRDSVCDYHFQESIASLIVHQDTEDQVLKNLPKLEFWTASVKPWGLKKVSYSDEFWSSLLRIPAVQTVYDSGELKLKPFKPVY